MKLEFQISAIDIGKILEELKSIENVEHATLEKKSAIQPNILDRKPNNQIEIIEVIVSIVITKISEEVYTFTKNEVLKYFKGKNISVKDNVGKSKKAKPRSK